MLSPEQVPPQIEKVMNRGMGCHKFLCLPRRLESPHPSLSYPGRLMGLLSTVVGILISDMDGAWGDFPVRDRIAT